MTTPLPQANRRVDDVQGHWLLARLGKRVLRPGGRLLLVDMMPHERTDFVESMGHLWPGFDAESISAWGRDAGFAPTTYHPLPADPVAKGPTLFAAVLRRGTSSTH